MSFGDETPSQHPAYLQVVQDASDSLQDPPTLEEMLEAVPLNVEIAVDLDALFDPSDPCRVESGRRFCIATRRAGGRCTAPPVTHSLLCTPHAGLLDSAAGGRAKAEKHRNQGLDADEQARLARLGARGVIAVTANEHPLLMRRAFLTLLEDAAAGDRTAAKLVGPWLNQGLGMPTESVVVKRPESIEDLASMPTSDLAALVAERKAARQLREREAAEAVGQAVEQG